MPGGNVITNGTFDSDTAWVKDIGGGTTTISGGVASVSGGIKFLTQTDCLEVGRAYRFSFLTSGASGGNLRIGNHPFLNQADTVFGPYAVFNGLNVGTFTAVNTAFSLEADNAAFSGVVDNVVVVPGKMTFINVGGVWKPVIKHINQSGVWKAATPAVKVGGVWKV